MKILGIVGSTRKPSRCGVHRLVSSVLENAGVNYERVHLVGKHFSGGIAGRGCVKDNICIVLDDLKHPRGGHDRHPRTAAMRKKMMARMALSAR